MLKCVLIGLVGAVMLMTGTANAGPFEDGKAAYERGDYAEAMKRFRLAAEQGDAAAQFNLGTMYDKGVGVPQEYTVAAKWYRLAAEQGYAEAQFNLGYMYYHGEGVPQDYAEAMKWFRLAAEQGLAVAQYTLGQLYLDGAGVPENYVLAQMYFNLAAAQGYENAKESLNFITQYMTPDQIAEAQRMTQNLAVPTEEPTDQDVAQAQEGTIDPDAIAKEIRAAFPANIDGEYECYDKLKTETVDRLFEEYGDTVSARAIYKISIFAAVYVCEPVSPQAHAVDPACMVLLAAISRSETPQHSECDEAEDNSKDWWFQFARTHPQIVEKFRQ